MLAKISRYTVCNKLEVKYSNGDIAMLIKTNKKWTQRCSVKVKVEENSNWRTCFIRGSHKTAEL